MSDKGRAMVYPYTLSAKFAQFPYKFYFTNNWVWKYWAVGVLLSIPVFAKIQALSYSPENVKKYEETKRLEREGHH